MNLLKSAVRQGQPEIKLTTATSACEPVRPMMSLVLVHAGTPTIFANFRTFIRLYLIIFHRYITLYIATLHHNATSHVYISLL
jgi:hypothetical protein